jgi:hypothetical protein
VGDAGASALAGSDHLGRLEGLLLLHTGLTAEGAATLAESVHLSRLQTLDIQGNRIGKAGKDALRAAGFRYRDQQWHRKRAASRHAAG